MKTLEQLTSTINDNLRAADASLTSYVLSEFDNSYLIEAAHAEQAKQEQQVKQEQQAVQIDNSQGSNKESANVQSRKLTAEEMEFQINQTVLRYLEAELYLCLKRKVELKTGAEDVQNKNFVDKKGLKNLVENKEKVDELIVAGRMVYEIDKVEITSWPLAEELNLMRDKLFGKSITVETAEAVKAEALKKLPAYVFPEKIKEKDLLAFEKQLLSRISEVNKRKVELVNIISSQRPSQPALNSSVPTEVVNPLKKSRELYERSLSHLKSELKAEKEMLVWHEKQLVRTIYKMLESSKLYEPKEILKKIKVAYDKEMDQWTVELSKEFDLAEAMRVCKTVLDNHIKMSQEDLQQFKKDRATLREQLSEEAKTKEQVGFVNKSYWLKQRQAQREVLQARLNEVKQNYDKIYEEVQPLLQTSYEDSNFYQNSQKANELDKQLSELKVEYTEIQKEIAEVDKRIQFLKEKLASNESDNTFKSTVPEKVQQVIECEKKIKQEEGTLKQAEGKLEQYEKAAQAVEEQRNKKNALEREVKLLTPVEESKQDNSKKESKEETGVANPQHPPQQVDVNSEKKEAETSYTVSDAHVLLCKFKVAKEDQDVTLAKGAYAIYEAAESSNTTPSVVTQVHNAWNTWKPIEQNWQKVQSSNNLGEKLALLREHERKLTGVIQAYSENLRELEKRKKPEEDRKLKAVITGLREKAVDQHVAVRAALIENRYYKLYNKEKDQTFAEANQLQVVADFFGMPKPKQGEMLSYASILTYAKSKKISKSNYKYVLVELLDEFVNDKLTTKQFNDKLTAFFADNYVNKSGFNPFNWPMLYNMKKLQKFKEGFEKTAIQDLADVIVSEAKQVSITEGMQTWVITYIQQRHVSVTELQQQLNCSNTGTEISKAILNRRVKQAFETTKDEAGYNEVITPIVTALPRPCIA